MRDLIGIKSPIYTVNDQSGTDVAYEDPDTVYARVTPLRNTRDLDAAGLAYNNPLEIYCRFVETTKDDLIEYAGKNYTIHSIEDVNNIRQYLKIICYGTSV